MTETGIFCSGAHVVRKAGANVSLSGATIDFTNDFIAQAESYINVATRFNWSNVFDTLDSDTKMILREAASNIAALYSIQYDMTNYTSRAEAELMMTVLYQRAVDCLKVLEDIKAQQFLKGE